MAEYVAVFVERISVTIPFFYKGLQSVLFIAKLPRYTDKQIIQEAVCGRTGSN